MLLQSGLKVNTAKFLGLALLSMLVGLALSMWLALPVLMVIFFCIMFGLFPLIYVQHLRSKRMTTIESQLPDAMDLMARAMQAGHSFASALKMVGDEMQDPISQEFISVFNEINYGISVQDSLQNLVKRVPSTDLSYFVIAALIQRETGGNLSKLLSNISNLIRDRLKLLGSVRVLAAEGVLSAKILTALPFILSVVIFSINPKHMSSLWLDPLGLTMIYMALLMIVFGIFLMWRIIKIRI